jgi:hypothetical protein
LYPALTRDLLLTLSRTGLFRARWTDQIHDEWIAAVLRENPHLAGRLARTRALMDDSVLDCLITGYESLVDGLTLPDPDDRHVLAAAIKGRADVIVTKNLKDFPAAALAPFGIEPQHPDAFVLHQISLNMDRALAAIAKLRARLVRPAMDVREFLDSIARELPNTAASLRGKSDYL